MREKNVTSARSDCRVQVGFDGDPNRAVRVGRSKYVGAEHDKG